jgi:K(+)-stimulated pyrophosphate-energized sodium pump
MTWLLYLVPLAGIAALAFAFLKAKWVSEQDPGDETMREIAGNIADGARAFLRAEYSRLAVFVAVVAVVLTIFYAVADTGTHWLIGLSFVVGAGFSGLAGFFGMKVATEANVRTANAARTGLSGALQVAFSGGLVMGLTVVGLGLIGLSVLYILYDLLFVAGLDAAPTAAAELAFRLETKTAIATLSGFSLGASSIALFARVGGGIYTKAADVGADLAGKVYAGIPEDDPRNPATIADNVGDNVGDVAGMGADLFESYVGSILGTMLLGAAFIPAMLVADAAPLSAVILPLVLAAVGAIVAIGGSFLVKTKDGGNPQHALNLGEFASAGVMMLLSVLIIFLMLPGEWTMVDPLGGTERVYTWWGVLLAVVIGLVSGLAIGLITEYYCSTTKKPTLEIARQSTTGSATNIISGLAVGMMSTGGPIIVLALGIMGAAYFAGLYGIAIAAVGLLSVLGIQLAVDAYGPISDNAGGIAEMAGLPPEVRERTDLLDAVGNTTAAIGKGFAIGSAALTALALFAAYLGVINLGQMPGSAAYVTLDISNPVVMAGLFIGAMLPYVFSALAMNAVGRAARDMIDEVGRQFNEIDGLREGRPGVKAEYAKCVEISTKASLREMILPGVLAVLAPVIVGIISPTMLGGLLAGVTVSGVLMALFQANAGGAWDNAKKRIEQGVTLADGTVLKKGDDAHKAAVVGDTVGDPLKDTSGPSINILMKLIAVVALVIAPLIAADSSEREPDVANVTVIVPAE